jgi:hypothetical protein
MCGSRAYQRYGGVKVPATRIDESTVPPTQSQTSMVTGKHFMCKGCSVHFGNPNLFNAVNVAQRKMKQADTLTKNLFDMIGITNEDA